MYYFYYTNISTCPKIPERRPDPTQRNAHVALKNVDNWWRQIGLKAEWVSQYSKIRIIVETTGTFLNALEARTNPGNPERIAALTHPAAQPLLITPLCEFRAHSSPQQHRRDLFLIYSYISVVCGQHKIISIPQFSTFPSLLSTIDFR